MDLQELKQNWEAFAVSDPMWAILTVHEKRGGKWNPEEFFKSGQTEISVIFELARRYGFDFAKRTALDFGCGIGRLTQALCEHFERCYGIDIAPSMIANAKRLNRFADRCVYIQNDREDLNVLDDGSMDFIYSNIVLQHMQPVYSKSYLREFLRVLAPNGLLVFQVPATRMTNCENGGSRNCSRATGPLASMAFRAAIKAPVRNYSVTPGEQMLVVLEVTNSSTEPWPALGLEDGTFQLFVGNHWRSRDGAMLEFDDARATFPHDLAPRESVTLRLAPTAPLAPGDYFLDFDAGQEKVTWFQDWGSAPLSIPVCVRTTRTSSAGLFRRLRENNSGLRRLIQMAGLGRLARKFRSAIGPSEDGKLVMEMYGVPRDEVETLIAEGGGTLLRVEEDFCAGPEWKSYRYWVRKPHD